MPQMRVRLARANLGATRRQGPVLPLHDVLGLYAYDSERREQAALDEASLEVAKGSGISGTRTPAAKPSPAKASPSQLGRSG